MRKPFVKFFLTVFIILLSGYASAFGADDKKDCLSCTSMELLKGAAENTFGDFLCSEDWSLNSNLTEVSMLHGHEFKIEITDSEVEEENLHNLDKNYQSDNFCITGFYALSAAYTHSCTHKQLSHSGHLFYAPVIRRYIMFRVFRI